MREARASVVGFGPGCACQGVNQPYNGALIAFRQQRNALKSLPQTQTLRITRYLFKLRCLARLRLDAQQFRLMRRRHTYSPHSWSFGGWVCYRRISSPLLLLTTLRSRLLQKRNGGFEDGTIFPALL